MSPPPVAPMLALLPFTVLVLWADSRVPGPWAQHLLALPVWGWLLLWARPRAVVQRRELWACVAVCGALELGLSLGWGLYTYRFHFVPFYVFGGHGLLFLFAQDAAARIGTGRRARQVCAATLAVATAWALAGLSGRLGAARDWHGAFYWPIFVALLVGAPRRAAYAATFGFASGIELLGTHLGTWHWSPNVPGLGWPSGDPPSGIGGGYCLAAALAQALVAASSARRQPGTPPAGVPAAA